MSKNTNLSIEEQIELTLAKVRPFIMRDGGDVEFVRFEDGIVYIRMLGACQGCPMLDQTINDGLEVILMDEVPGVLGVRLAD
ncbi:MAG: NifU family protein [Bacilli bacterium]|jgi:Fe-S cluster biogenesis protein NfuA